MLMTLAATLTGRNVTISLTVLTAPMKEGVVCSLFEGYNDTYIVRHITLKTFLDMCIVTNIAVVVFSCFCVVVVLLVFLFFVVIVLLSFFIYLFYTNNDTTLVTKVQ